MVFLLLEFAVGSAAGSRSVEAADFAEEPALADYIEWALEHHPDLAAGRARVEAIRGEARGQGSLPDLKLAWGEMIVPVETRVGPQQRVFSLSQNIPWFGTLGLREAATSAEADAEQARLENVILTINHGIRSAWFELALVQHESELVTEHLALVRQSESSLRAAYESGSSRYAQVLEAQMESARLQKRWAGLTDRAGAVSSRLHTAAGFELAPPIPNADLPDSFLSAVTWPDRPRMLELLDRRHPRLAALDHRRESRNLRLELAERRRYPELTVGLDYIMTDSARSPDVTDSGKDPVVARVSINLPVWGGKTDAEKNSALGRLRAVTADRRSLRLELIRSLDEILYRWRDALRELELHDNILLPHIRQLVQVKRSHFSAARTDYTGLLAVGQSHLQLELGRLRALHDLAQAANDLATLLNIPMNLVTDQHIPLGGWSDRKESQR